MFKYICKRVVSIFVTLLIVCSLTFVMMKIIPGGPFTGEKNLPDSVLESLNEKYHLNDPVLKQYTDYIKGVFTFNMGPSFKKVGVNVQDIIRESFPVSAKLGGVTLVIILIVGIPLGIWAALGRGRWQDYLVTIIATVGIAVPTFVTGSLILYVFGAKLGWIPTYGFDSWKCYIGPCVSLAAFSMAFVMRLTRSSMLDVMGQDYPYCKGQRPSKKKSNLQACIQKCADSGCDLCRTNDSRIDVRILRNRKNLRNSGNGKILCRSDQ